VWEFRMRYEQGKGYTRNAIDTAEFLELERATYFQLEGGGKRLIQT
jgi:hypothetical protein